jgi:hypothetical protein
MATSMEVESPFEKPVILTKIKVKKGFPVNRGTLLGFYKTEDSDQVQKWKCQLVGTVKTVNVKEGHTLAPG